MPFVDSQPLKKSGSTRRATAKASVSTRPRILSDEEKHQLILAHASSRRSVDHIQQLSLWAGVIICAAAIGVGWLYSLRQSVASAFPEIKHSINNAVQGSEDAAWQRYQLKQELQTSADNMLKQVEKIENEQMGGGINKMIENSMNLMDTVSGTAMKIASSTKKNILPPGVKQDR